MNDDESEHWEQLQVKHSVLFVQPGWINLPMTRTSFQHMPFLLDVGLVITFV